MDLCAVHWLSPGLCCQGGPPSDGRGDVTRVSVGQENECKYIGIAIFVCVCVCV